MDPVPSAEATFRQRTAPSVPAPSLLVPATETPLVNEVDQQLSALQSVGGTRFSHLLARRLGLHVI